MSVMVAVTPGAHSSVQSAGIAAACCAGMIETSPAKIDTATRIELILVVPTTSISV